MSFAEDCEKRLRFADRSTVELYKRIFGYSTVSVSGECSIPRRYVDALGLSPGGSVSGEGDGGGLVVGGGADAVGDGDKISPEQFVVDLETIAAIPKDLAGEFDHAGFVEVVRRYAEGFRKRGWVVFFDCRKSIGLLEPEYAEADSPGSPVYSPRDDVPGRSGAGFRRILVVCDGSSVLYERLSDELGDSCRVERYWLAYFLREWVVERLCNRYAIALGRLGVRLVLTNCSWAFDHFLASENATSSETEKRAAFSKDAIDCDDERSRRFLSSVFEEDEGLAIAKFKGSSCIPAVIEPVPGSARHADARGAFLNVRNGIRATSDGPLRWDNSIYLFGGCTLFGYVVDDANTIPSHLQRVLNRRVSERSWRVVNYGTWGGNFEHSHLRLGDIAFREGDIVLVNHAMGNRLDDSLCSSCFDLSEAFSGHSLSGEQYYDRVIHCGAYGYRVLADYLFEKLSHLFSAKGVPLSDGVRKLDLGTAEAMPEGLSSFVRGVEEECPFPLREGKRVGCLVMNCNPFTLGHRHVIEYASSRVDYLIVFVVEEDRSLFPFEDRIRLVRQGVSDLGNVHVHRSGSLIISTTTFPGYFVKSDPGKADVDPTLDVEMFAKWIAPQLGISVRFAGEEPFDFVTRGYNEKMSEVLPLHGISFVEIPRKTVLLPDGSRMAISASSVRKELELGDYDALARLVPGTTLAYLRVRFGRE